MASDNSQILPEHQLYQVYDLAEKTRRINTHYDHDPKFFSYFLGEGWQSYSSLYWPHSQATITEAEEHKFDYFAELMALKPGMHILDIGCAWGGALTYLCKTYDVTGVGITLSEKQCTIARERAAKYGANAQFYVSPWETFVDSLGFDIIYSDEATVHFQDLSGFFCRMHGLLKPNGFLMCKELHYTHPRYIPVNRATKVVNEVFGYTGNYRVLADELFTLYQNGFEIRRIEQMDIRHYARTVDAWLSHLFLYRAEIKALVGSEIYNAFRCYLKVARRSLGNNSLTLDIVLSQKTPLF